jgi:cellulose synthase/poly-beta-1,6-N-acetylglucosamine synthase-like glycosyltransferase
MIDVLIHLQLIIFIPIGFFIFYLAILTLLALMAKRNSTFEGGHQRNIAVVIPAHNEEIAIKKTLQSAFALEYPRNKFSVMVVADNCSDKTKSIAQAEGAKVYERFNSNLRGKGYALRWIFDIILPENLYEAVVIVDADSTMSKNFLTVMNFYLNKGAVSLQSTDIVETGSASWSASMIRISFLLYNLVRPLGRRVLGLPVGLRGNGMCLAIDTLKDVPWNAYSLAEDVDYGIQLLLNNKPTYFAPEAVVYATMPQQAENAQSQRARWEGGRVSLIRKYSLLLLKTAWKQRSYKFFDALIDLLTPSIVNMIALVGVMAIINGIISVAISSQANIFFILWLFAGLCGLFHLFLGLYAARADKELYKALFNIPRYFLWKIGLYLHIFKGEQRGEWIRTPREIK